VTLNAFIDLLKVNVYTKRKPLTKKVSVVLYVTKTNDLRIKIIINRITADEMALSFLENPPMYNLG